MPIPVRGTFTPRPNIEHRLARVLQIVAAIATEPGRWTRTDLAERFDISERMITKDLSIIRRALGLALGHEEPDGGYYFVREPEHALVLAARNARPPHE
jgi:predicted DNA-binding transcriptional regulator YafY